MTILWIIVARSNELSTFRLMIHGLLRANWSASPLGVRHDGDEHDDQRRTALRVGWVRKLLLHELSVLQAARSLSAR